MGLSAANRDRTPRLFASDELCAGLWFFLEGEAWKRDALCLEHPEVNFFPDRGESSAPAKAVCARCLAADDCRDYALSNGIAEGIWGGTSGRDRRRVRSTERVAA